MANDYGFGNVERRLTRSETPFVKEAYERALYWLKSKAINPAKFPDHFHPETVERDMKHVAKMEAMWNAQDTPEAKEEKKVATVFEVSLWWLTQQRQFFGEKTKAVLPSRYDDLAGTDLILGVEGSDEQMSYLGLGIDATFGTQAVENKLSELGGKIRDGHTNRIKYFVSPDTRIKGSFDGVPHAVVGLSVENARELAALWRNSEKGEPVRKPVGEHPLRALILKQLVLQTSAAAALARASGHQELGNSYNAIYKRLSAIALEAERSVKDWKDPMGADYRHDPVHLKIMDAADRWRRQAVAAA